MGKKVKESESKVISMGDPGYFSSLQYVLNVSIDIAYEEGYKTFEAVDKYLHSEAFKNDYLLDEEDKPEEPRSYARLIALFDSQREAWVKAINMSNRVR